MAYVYTYESVHWVYVFTFLLIEGSVISCFLSSHSFRYIVAALHISRHHLLLQEWQRFLLMFDLFLSFCSICRETALLPGSLKRRKQCVWETFMPNALALSSGNGYGESKSQEINESLHNVPVSDGNVYCEWLWGQDSKMQTWSYCWFNLPLLSHNWLLTGFDRHVYKKMCSIHVIGLWIKKGENI